MISETIATALARFLLLTVLFGSGLAATAESESPRDPRQVYTGDHYLWPAATGKLSVPSQKHRDGYREHYIQDCSATLVSRLPTAKATVLVSAWHCFEYYRDLTRPILFSVQSGDGDKLTRSATLLTSGGDMQADWAILRLDKSISPSQVQALQPHPFPHSTPASIGMGGFSKDPGLGNHGRALTYHGKCQVTMATRYLHHSNCLAFKGASGGTVVSRWPDHDSYYFAGVVSAGNGGDTSVYIPLRAFISSLRPYLE